jgi:hypothetical protein
MNSAESAAPNAEPIPRRNRDEPMHPVQIAGFRKMSVAQKFATITAMREMGIKLRIVGLRMRHPDWSDEKLETEARKAAMYASTD